MLQLPGEIPGFSQHCSASLQLLSDRQAKTRCNAASALGNLGRRSAELGELLIESGAPRILLEMACRDPQASVREGALMALRAVSQHPGIQQVSALTRLMGQLVALRGWCRAVC